MTGYDRLEALLFEGLFFVAVGIARATCARGFFQLLGILVPVPLPQQLLNQSLRPVLPCAFLAAPAILPRLCL